MSHYQVAGEVDMQKSKAFRLNQYREAGNDLKDIKKDFYIDFCYRE